MNPLAAIGRALAFRKALRSDPQPFVHRHGRAEVQARQRAVAREVHLSDLTPSERQLAARTFGDIH